MARTGTATVFPHTIAMAVFDPELLEQAAKKRGFLVSRGEYDIERMANTLLGEYHEGKLGRLSLEEPDD